MSPFMGGVVTNCPWSCGLCEGQSFYYTWIDLDTNPTFPAPPPPPSTLCSPSCQTRMLDHPCSCIMVLCVVFFCSVPACISSTLDFWRLGCFCFCATSPYAGLSTGSQVPPSKKPSAEGMTACLSSESVQVTDGNFWSFGTIEAWDASIVLVDIGNFGEAKVELAGVRQYHSAKQCSSIQHGTESSLHSHPIPRTLLLLA
jgi:hypothetical protein